MSLKLMQSKGRMRAAVALLCLFTLVGQTTVDVAASGPVILPESSPNPSPPAPPQAGGASPIARISNYVGVVGVRNNAGWHQVVGVNAPLYSGDKVVTERGRCEITFNDGSLIRLDVGANVTIQERPTPSGGILRTINQYIGNLWFNIKRQTGTATHLETPTAIAAIRGTQGWQEVPDDSHSTHALTVGVEQITERVTQQTVTIHGGEEVTAIRGVGFTAITAIAALLGGKYPITSNARQLPKLPKNTGNVAQSERPPNLTQVNGINSRGLIVETAGRTGFSLHFLITTLAVMTVGAVVGSIIVTHSQSNGKHPNQTTVGSPTGVGVGPPH